MNFLTCDFNINQLKRLIYEIQPLLMKNKLVLLLFHLKTLTMKSAYESQEFIFRNVS